jgi:hypothetical protein
MVRKCVKMGYVLLMVYDLLRPPAASFGREYTSNSTSLVLLIWERILAVHREGDHDERWIPGEVREEERQVAKSTRKG